MLAGCTSQLLGKSELTSGGLELQPNPAAEGAAADGQGQPQMDQEKLRSPRSGGNSMWSPNVALSDWVLPSQEVGDGLGEAGKKILATGAADKVLGGGTGFVFQTL